MHVLRATYEKKANNDNSEENEYFLNIGKSGLRQIINETKTFPSKT